MRKISGKVDKSKLTTDSTMAVYWPSTEPSIKKCTCVYKRKNSRSRWSEVNYITRCYRRLGSVRVGGSHLGTRCRIESQQQTKGFGSSVTHGWAAQPKWGRSAAMAKRTLGQNNSLSSSPTHLSHTTNINPFENKVWEIYFYKEV